MATTKFGAQENLRFPDPQTHRHAAGVLMTIFARGRASASDVGMKNSLPAWFEALKTLKDHGWLPSDPRDPVVTLCVTYADGRQTASEDVTRRYARTILDTPAGVEWVDAVGRMVEAAAG